MIGQQREQMKLFATLATEIIVAVVIEGNHILGVIMTLLYLLLCPFLLLPLFVQGEPREVAVPIDKRER